MSFPIIAIEVNKTTHLLRFTQCVFARQGFNFNVLIEVHWISPEPSMQKLKLRAGVSLFWQVLQVLILLFTWAVLVI